MITRNEAKQKQLKTYFTGIPCKRGHVAERRIDNTCCIECGKISSLKYRQQHPNQIQRITQEYYQHHKERAIKYSKQWYQQNQIYKKQYNKQYYQQNKELLKRYAKTYRQQNPDICALNNERRYRHIKDCCPSWANKEAIKFFYECRPAGTHVDHVIPIVHPRICGLHVETNLQWLPSGLNLSKKNKFDL
ncbi:hypothetical protein LCGC14_1233080 [marine sediment metagenome]|uniref:HNH nuclease domain-containing protein n=1 Tax=marine sediment metagenome TaxID=412755 RepID=A0A0F9NQ71_9ZZZZ